MAHKRAAMGGRSLRLECLCLDSVFAGGLTTLAPCRVFRLVIKGSTRDHWTQAERDWARGGVGEAEIWWNVRQTYVQTMTSITERAAVKKWRHACLHMHIDHSTITKDSLCTFLFYLERIKPPLEHRSAVLQKKRDDEHGAVSFYMPHEQHFANNGKMLQ